ncbi:MAG: methyltransferase, partial [Planctomycetota bacterium]
RAKAIERSMSHVEFTHCDLDDPSLKKSDYSVVSAFNVLHLLSDLPSALSSISSILSPGGLLITETPCLGERGRFQRSFVGVAQAMGFAPSILHLTYASLKARILDAGFSVKHDNVCNQEYTTIRVVAEAAAG